jgi:hypothetical protein
MVFATGRYSEHRSIAANATLAGDAVNHVVVKGELTSNEAATLICVRGEVVQRLEFALQETKDDATSAFCAVEQVALWTALQGADQRPVPLENASVHLPTVPLPWDVHLLNALSG